MELLQQQRHRGLWPLAMTLQWWREHGACAPPKQPGYGKTAEKEP